MSAAPTIFIDGQEGTTGLRIRDLLGARQDLEILLIPAEQRKDTEARRQLLNQADIALLCLPDAAAGEALQLLDPAAGTRVVDTSSARRTADGWVYGLPEVSPAQREAIRGADRVANCGCYPVGFLLAVRPLIEAGLLSPDHPFTVNAVSGYTGGGRKMIEAYRDSPAAANGDAGQPFHLYGLDGGHKHLAEMHKYSLATGQPLFVPSVAHVDCGMLTSTPLPAAAWTRAGTTPEQVYEVWRARYGDEPFVQPIAPGDAAEHLRDGTRLDLTGARHSNRVELFVFGDPEAGLVLVGRLDNLGKGASGNAVQCLNLMLGVDETTGLV